jgi:hypothetical protein
MSITRVRGRSRRRQYKRTKRIYNKRRVGGQPSYVPVSAEKVFATYEDTSQEPNYYTNMNGHYVLLGNYDPTLDWQTLEHIHDPHKMIFRMGQTKRAIDNSSDNKIFKLKKN